MQHTTVGGPTTTAAGRQGEEGGRGRAAAEQLEEKVEVWI